MLASGAKRKQLLTSPAVSGGSELPDPGGGEEQLAGPLPGRLEGGQKAPKAPFYAGSGGHWKEHYSEHLGLAGEAPLPQDRGLSSSSRVLPSGLSRAAQEVPGICPRPAGAGRLVCKAQSAPALSPGLHVQVRVEMLRIHEVRELSRGEEQLPDAAEGEPGGGGRPVPALPLPVSSGAGLSPSLGCSFSPCEMMGPEEM